MSAEGFNGSGFRKEMNYELWTIQSLRLKIDDQRLKKDEVKT